VNEHLSGSGRASGSSRSRGGAAIRARHEGRLDRDAGPVVCGRSPLWCVPQCDTPPTYRPIKPVLINAADGTFSESCELPWYAKALFVSEPLHFGDHGGMPLKIIWALLDLATIVC
jgi:PepSY-associated TM region